jgi:uncharacterized protein YkwD
MDQSMGVRLGLFCVRRCAPIVLALVLAGCGLEREELGPQPGGWGPGDPDGEQEETGTDAGDGGDDEDTTDAGEADDGTGTGGADDEGETSGDDDPEEDDTGGDDPPPPDADVPDNDYCSDVADWNPSHVAIEEELLVLVNQQRAQGASCGAFGSFAPSGPLVMHPALRCAARKHSKDMAERNFFDHTNPDGENGGNRMARAGYDGSSGSENIAAGQQTAASVMSAWMGSDGHCMNIMRAANRDFGAGYYTGGSYGHLWTQLFGAP